MEFLDDDPADLIAQLGDVYPELVRNRDEVVRILSGEEERFLRTLETGTTLLEGWFTRLGSWLQWLFLVYFVLWSFFVGGALITACGVAGAAILPLGSPTLSKNIWSIVHSLVGLAIVRAGGFALFERIMGGFIAVKFVAVLVTASASRNAGSSPTIPERS